MEISTVPVNFVRALLQAAERKGCVVEDVLSHVQISPELIAEDKARIPAEQYSALVEHISTELQDEYCGLVDQRVKPGSLRLFSGRPEFVEMRCF